MKNPKYTFCREFNFEYIKNFVDDDVIIVTSSVHRTQSTGVLLNISVSFLTYRPSSFNICPICQNITNHTTYNNLS